MMNEPSISNICHALDAEYGSPRHGNKDDPLDELFYIILSTRTRHLAYCSSYELVRREFPSWSDITPDREGDLALLLRPFGLGHLKAKQIVDIVARLRDANGTVTLDNLFQMDDDEAERTLTQLPGVGKKVAKCVMMYSLGRDVLPVDVHVHRVSARIGLRTKRRPDTSQDLIEIVVPPHLRYGFHVNVISHGRLVCTSGAPRCDACCISQWCAYYSSNLAAKGID